MLKITVIILASIISAVILQDAGNQDQAQTNGCLEARPANEPVIPAYIATTPPPLPKENVLYEPKTYESPVYYEKPKVAEEKLYKSQPESYIEPQYYNNRRKSYPNPISAQHLSNEAEEKLPYTIEKKSKDCDNNKKLNPDKNTRRAYENRDDLQDIHHNDYQIENNHAVQPDEMEDPISHRSVSPVNENNKPLLMNNPRVCYACSSATNPTCWEPNQRTTVKYCSKEHASCITKTFGEGPTLTVIRDCATSCSQGPVPGLEPKYKSCKVCHSDLCNGAFSIQSYNLMYVLLVFTALKFTF